ncbi:6-phospho-beta-glucosidase [Brachybacterium sp. EF45031]|uniref:6-phospho-beta-glucosidase n=1 Tax=Brachybacterium sillae TaxID=2810536 RepID=UPI00217DBDF2|nr:6-phospho-beta-glucosidase [Brachybacterium sillae]MCS6711776.1 6-phospho-beta-glucosidase [Brachybacterium sillae]
MKLALLGGGGFRVPLVVRTLLADTSEARVRELRLHDVDADRLRAMAGILEVLTSEHPDPPRVVLSDSLEEAVRGADVVFSAIRVGGTEGRAADERIARSVGIIGQETTGFGGISYALRGLPVARDIARTVADLAPDAWLINFTNPAGIITEASREHLGDRVIGICDSPIGLARRALSVLERRGDLPAGTARDVGTGASPVRLDYAGLNHLGWLQGVVVDGRDVLPRLLADPEAIESFEEGRLFGAEWIRTLGCIPNEYLHYYYFAREVREADAASDVTRGVYLARQQSEFYSRAAGADGAEVQQLWERTRRDREATYMASSREAAGGIEREEEDLESGGYDRVALAIMHAVAGQEPAQLILNVRNGSTLPQLPADAVVEVPCRVDAHGPEPLEVSGLPGHALGLVQTVKEVERTVIRASTTGSRDLAVEALALHPLVDGFGVARRALDAALDTFPQLAYLR